MYSFLLIITASAQWFWKNKAIRTDPDTVDYLNVEELQNIIDGRIVLPTDDDYDVHRSCWNKDSEGTPSAIVRVETYQDVVETVL